MRLSPVELDREPLTLLSAVATQRGASWVQVPDAADPVTLIGVTPTAELRIGGDGLISRDGAVSAESDPIAAIARFVREAPTVPDAPFPLRGGVVVYLAYELGHWTVPRIARRATDTPLAV